MIRKKEDMRLQKRENLRGGVGAIDTHHILESEEFCAKGTLCSVMTFEPGCSIGEHPHGPDAEIYYILEGELIVTDQGVEHTLHVGDVMYTTNGEIHSVRNGSDKRARMMAIVLS